MKLVVLTHNLRKVTPNLDHSTSNFINDLAQKKDWITISNSLINQSDALLLGIIILFLLVISISLLFYYRHKMYKLNLLAIGKDKEYEIQKIIKQNKIKILNSNLEGQEIERNRLAKELHDGIGAQLTGLIYFIRSKDYQFQNKDVDVLLTELKDLQRYVRNVSHQLAHPDEVEFDLPEMVQEQLLWINNTNTQVKLNFDPSIKWEKIPEDHEEHLYRIIQEAITNGLKHSKATNINLTIKSGNNKINIEVLDNGVGNAIIKSRGIGIRNMKERAEVIGADFFLDSEPQEGTKIIVKYPIYN